jgi:ATP-dependent DNA ligase
VEGTCSTPVGVSDRRRNGYHLIARKQDGRVSLSTRRGYDWTDRYPLIRQTVAALHPASVTIDGEAVVCDETWRCSRSCIAASMTAKRSSMPLTCSNSTARTGAHGR